MSYEKQNPVDGATYQPMREPRYTDIATSAAIIIGFLLGAMLAGLLVGVAEKLHVMSNELRLFLFTGILGGFTTFSAFGVETLHLLRKGELAIAAGYAGLSVACGLAVLWAGWYLVPARAV